MRSGGELERWRSVVVIEVKESRNKPRNIYKHRARSHTTISITGFTIILPSKTTGPVQSSERRRH